MGIVGNTPFGPGGGINIPQSMTPVSAPQPAKDGDIDNLFDTASSNQFQPGSRRQSEYFLNNNHYNDPFEDVLNNPLPTEKEEKEKEYFKEDMSTVSAIFA